MCQEHRRHDKYKSSSLILPVKIAPPRPFPPSQHSQGQVEPHIVQSHQMQPKVQLFLLTHHLANPFCSSAPAVIHKWLRIHYDELRWYQQSWPTARNSQKDCTRECSKWLRGTGIIWEKTLLIPKSHLGQLQVNVFSLTHSKHLIEPLKTVRTMQTQTGLTVVTCVACLTSASRADFH